jgi:hypothetical protein
MKHYFQLFRAKKKIFHEKSVDNQKVNFLPNHK